MAEEDILVVLLAASNFLSAYYTAFCIEASTKRYHWFYKALHRNDLNWYATWYSCQVRPQYSFYQIGDESPNNLVRLLLSSYQAQTLYSYMSSVSVCEVGF